MPSNVTPHPHFKPNRNNTPSINTLIQYFVGGIESSEIQPILLKSLDSSHVIQYQKSSGSKFLPVMTQDMKADEHYTLNTGPGILVVDDEESVHLLYREELEDEEGYIVHSATNGEEALEIFDLAMHLGKPQIDLVILDINMPGMDGIEVLRQIKQKNPNMPVILSSAYPEYKAELASWASDDYIVKSFSLDDLKASVRRLLRK